MRENALIMKYSIAMQAAAIPMYAGADSRSRKYSASLKASRLLKTYANVLLVKCISIVSFSEPVL